VNKQGKIQAIIDWENCASNIAPYWDLSIALHDLSIDGKQRFLEGYGLNFEEFNSMSYALAAFNMINYVPALERAIAKKNKLRLEFYRLRLNGAFDLFSL
jgi:hygromycin-B 4-O-kinase